VLIFVSLLIYAIVAWATRKAVVARGWPFCARCAAIRVLWFLTGLATFAAGVIAIYVAQSPGSSVLSLSSALILVTGLILFLAGIVILTTSGWATVARASVSRDGVWVRVRKAHPEFDAQVRATMGTPQPIARAWY
jgi:hypothetical protein